MRHSVRRLQVMMLDDSFATAGLGPPGRGEGPLNLAAPLVPLRARRALLAFHGEEGRNHIVAYACDARVCAACHARAFALGSTHRALSAGC